MALPAGALDVINAALILLSRQPLPTLEDDHPHAVAARAVWRSTIDGLLRRADWNFSTRWIKSPSAIAGGYDGPFPYRYALPSNCLKVRFLEGIEDEAWHVETGPETIPATEAVMVLATGVVAPQICYTARIDEPSLWDAAFRTAAEETLAAKLAAVVKGGQALAATWRANADDSTRKAALHDAREKSREVIGSNTRWLAVRR